MQTYYCEKKCCLIKVDSKVTSLPSRSGRTCKAGVFIYDKDSDAVLLVQSRGKLWGPPKGTIEIGETASDCAVREVREETGLVITPENFSRAIKIKNRAIYYYLEMTVTDVEPQLDLVDNDVNGITWIKLDCLQSMITNGNIVLSEQCKIAFKKFLGRYFTSMEFTRVKPRKRRRIPTIVLPSSKPRLNYLV